MENEPIDSKVYNQVERDLAAVDSALAISKEHNLQAEVMLDAMMAIKTNSTITIPDALQCSIAEWIK